MDYSYNPSAPSYDTAPPPSYGDPSPMKSDFCTSCGQKLYGSPCPTCPPAQAAYQAPAQPTYQVPAAAPAPAAPYQAQPQPSLFLQAETMMTPQQRQAHSLAMARQQEAGQKAVKMVVIIVIVSVLFTVLLPIIAMVVIFSILFG